MGFSLLFQGLKNEVLWAEAEGWDQLHTQKWLPGGRGAWSPSSSRKSSQGGHPGQNPVINGPLLVEQRGSVPI